MATKSPPMTKRYGLWMKTYHLKMTNLRLAICAGNAICCGRWSRKVRRSFDQFYKGLMLAWGASPRLSHRNKYRLCKTPGRLQMGKSWPGSVRKQPNLRSADAGRALLSRRPRRPGCHLHLRHRSPRRSLLWSRQRPCSGEVLFLFLSPNLNPILTIICCPVRVHVWQLYFACRLDRLHGVGNLHSCRK